MCTMDQLDMGISETWSDRPTDKHDLPSLKDHKGDHRKVHMDSRIEASSNNRSISPYIRDHKYIKPLREGSEISHRGPRSHPHLPRTRTRENKAESSDCPQAPQVSPTHTTQGPCLGTQQEPQKYAPGRQNRRTSLHKRHAESLSQYSDTKQEFCWQR